MPADPGRRRMLTGRPIVPRTGRLTRRGIAVSYSFCERGLSFPFLPPSRSGVHAVSLSRRLAPGPRRAHLVRPHRPEGRRHQLREVRDPQPDRAPARFVRLVRGQGPAGAVRRDQPDQGLHRQGDGAPVPRLRVRGAQVLRGGVPDQGPDLQQAALRQRRAPDQGDRRDPAPARLHGRLPVDDRPGHLRHQRRRARRRQPARPLAGRLLQRDRGPGLGPDAVLRQGHPEPRRLARVRDEQQGPALGQGRPQAQDRGDDPAARRRLRAERRDRARCSPRSTSIPSTRTSRRPSTRTSPTPSRRPSSRSTRSCARATRPPATTPASSSRACSSTSAATTSAGSAATSSTRSSTRSPSRHGHRARRARAGRSPARTSPRSSATSSSATAASIPRTTSTTSATAASGPTAS